MVFLDPFPPYFIEEQRMESLRAKFLMLDNKLGVGGGGGGEKTNRPITNIFILLMKEQESITLKTMETDFFYVFLKR